MAYVIDDSCISCGNCEDKCPVDCISEGDDIYVIDADVCIDCAACVPACPVDAIKPAQFIEKRGRFYIALDTVVEKPREG